MYNNKLVKILFTDVAVGIFLILEILRFKINYFGYFVEGIQYDNSYDHLVD